MPPSHPAVAGVHGLRLHGLEAVGHRLAAAGGSWPELHVEHEADVGGPPAGDPDDPHRVVVAYRSGWAEIDRRTRVARVHTGPGVGPEELLHPLLSPLAATVARWDGREALHGGGVVGADGAWLVLASRGAGKSTALAGLVLSGRALVADDLVVVDGGMAFPGPRAVDLRPDSADLLGVRQAAEVVRGGERLRLAAHGACGPLPIAGLVFLEWSVHDEVGRLGPADTLRRLAGCRATGNAASSAVLALELIGIPAYRVARRATWPAHRTCEAIDELVG